MAAMKLLVSLFILTMVSVGELAVAQVVEHVVSGDRVADTSTDRGPWSSGHTFRVGDSLLFKSFLPEELVVELASMEEYDACDLSNPIKMYTDPVNKVALENEGTRYFASASYDKCRNGHKLPVQVEPYILPMPPQFPTAPPAPQFPTAPPAPQFPTVPPPPRALSVPPPPHALTVPPPPRVLPGPPPHPSSGTSLYGLKALVFIGVAFGVYSL